MDRDTAIHEVMKILDHLTECCLDETICLGLAARVVDDAVRFMDPK